MKLRAFVVGIVVLAALPARAHTAPGTDVVWDGAISCTVLCSYGAGGAYSPCEYPFPPWSYDDVETESAPQAPPGTVTMLRVVLYNQVDWDLFVCAGPRGAELAQGATHVGEPCDTLLGPNTSTLVGCHEDASTPVKAGQTYILRAYNWLDVLPAHGRYWYEFV